jgi:uncharacterized membrane protein
LSEGPNHNQFHGFVDDKGIISTVDDPLGVASGYMTVLEGINNEGTIIGEYYSSDYSHSYGFEDIGGVFTNIAVPGASYTQVWGISNNGIIVGDYTDPNGKSSEFTDRNGVFATVIAPNPNEWTYIRDVNDAGVLVGQFVYDNGVTGGAFIATPLSVPEPSTWAMMLIGLAGLGFARYVLQTGSHKREHTWNYS